MTSIFSVAILISATLMAAGQGNTRKKLNVPEVNQECMECICQASSDCDESLRCHNAGADSYFCGPYVISWAYWHDGGRPGDKGRAHDFETCLNEKKCAEQAVRGYMKKHGRDCDGDGVITCDDFARIHKLGPGACSSDSIAHTDYWQKYEACYPYNNAEYDQLDARKKPA